MTAPAKLGAAVWTWLMLGFLNLPIAMIAFISFSAGEFLSFPPPGLSLRWYAAYLGSDRWVGSTITSIEIATATVLLATPLGVAASFGLIRGRFPGRAILLQLATAPMIVPGIIAAVGFYFFFAHLGLIGTRVAIVLAHTALAVPLVVINVVGALRSFDIDLERAARNLGATRWRAFWHVTRPLLQPSVLTGALFAFLMSFDELVVALFIGGADTTTLPMRMWSSLRDEIDPTIAAISTFLIALSGLVIFGAGRIRQRGGTASPSRFF